MLRLARARRISTPRFWLRRTRRLRRERKRAIRWSGFRRWLTERRRTLDAVGKLLIAGIGPLLVVTVGITLLEFIAFAVRTITQNPEFPLFGALGLESDGTVSAFLGTGVAVAATLLGKDAIPTDSHWWDTTPTHENWLTIDATKLDIAMQTSVGFPPQVASDYLWLEKKLARLLQTHLRRPVERAVVQTRSRPLNRWRVSLPTSLQDFKSGKLWRLKPHGAGQLSACQDQMRVMSPEPIVR